MSIALSSPQLLRAEVEAAGQLAHDHQVDVAVAHRPQVRERVELACGAPAAPARDAAADVSQRGPPTAPSSTASDALTAARTCDGNGSPCLSIASPPNGRCTWRRRDAEQLARRVDHAAGLGHHLGADAVARQGRRRWGRAGVGSSWLQSHQTPASSCSGSVAVLACAHARRYASADASVMSVETAWLAKLRPADSTTTRTSPSASAPPETAPIVYSTSVDRNPEQLVDRAEHGVHGTVALRLRGLLAARRCARSSRPAPARPVRVEMASDTRW